MANALAPQTAHADAAAPKGALDPNEFRAFKLKEKKQLTGNTYLFRWALEQNRGPAPADGPHGSPEHLQGQGLLLNTRQPGHSLLSICIH